MIKFLKQQARDLFPGYFALVMATGALSIGSFLLGMESISTILLYINIVAYLTLWLLTIIRLVGYFPSSFR
ncbi:SLAC1 family transporter [Virgibacillus sp. L01]|uniref:SLAC1 family transporter n=1 Tax=Virgibacillus sp. L01 TaxID=3457429 RepID=UPI003FD3E7DC